jgi:hypothetical protein
LDRKNSGLGSPASLAAVSSHLISTGDPQD